MLAQRSSCFLLHSPVPQTTYTKCRRKDSARLHGGITVRASRQNKQTNLQQHGQQPSLARTALLGLAGALLVGTMNTAPPAFADLQTVSPDQALQQAKPLKVQTVDKRKVWFIFILGAASLFGTVVVLENNGTLFPAISRANRAMAQARKQAQNDETMEEAYLRALEEGQGVGAPQGASQGLQQAAVVDDAAANEEARLAAAVQAGLQEAKQRVVQQQSSTSGTSNQEATHNTPSVQASDASASVLRSSDAVTTTSFPATLSANDVEVGTTANSATSVNSTDADSPDVDSALGTISSGVTSTTDAVVTASEPVAMTSENSGNNKNSGGSGYVVVSQDADLQGTAVQQVQAAAAATVQQSREALNTLKKQLDNARKQ